jgi:hypothetical protein
MAAGRDAVIGLASGAGAGAGAVPAGGVGGPTAAAAAAAGKIDAVMVMTLTRSHHGMLWQQERSILGKRAVEGERSLESCSGRRST